MPNISADTPPSNDHGEIIAEVDDDGYPLFVSTPATKAAEAMNAVDADADHRHGICGCDTDWHCEASPEGAALLAENGALVAATEARCGREQPARTDRLRAYSDGLRDAYSSDVTYPNGHRFRNRWPDPPTAWREAAARHDAAQHDKDAMPIPQPAQNGQEAPTLADDWEALIAARRYVFDYDDTEDLAPIACLLHRPDDRGIFPEKRISWIAGQPGSGKSWIVYFAIMEALLQGGRVLYIDTDDIGDNFKRRTRILGGKGVFDQPNFFYTNEPPNRYADNYEPDDPLHDPLHHALCKWLEASEGPRVVVIDSAFSSGADSSGASIAQWAYDRIDLWKEQEPTIIVVDHVPKRDKPGARTGRGGIGSQDKLALVTGVSYYVPSLKCWTDTEGGRVTLIVDKDKTSGTSAKPLDTYCTFVGAWHDTPAGRAFDWTIHMPDEPTPDHDDGIPYEERIEADIHTALTAAQDGLTITTIRKAVRGKTGNRRRRSRAHGPPEHPHQNRQRLPNQPTPTHPPNMTRNSSTLTYLPGTGPLVPRSPAL